MQMAMKDLDCPVDYINPHATSTPIGDIKEIEALREDFSEHAHHRARTAKALAAPMSAHCSHQIAPPGHSLGAAGAQEAIYTLLMMQGDFIAASAHIDTLDPDFADMPIIRERKDNAGITCAMSNSFGFGGTNGSHRTLW